VVAFGHDQLDLSNLLNSRRIREVRPQLIVMLPHIRLSTSGNRRNDAQPQAEAPIAGEEAEDWRCFGPLLTDSCSTGQELPYDEADSTNPINVYGKTKFAGEKLFAFRCAILIFRTLGLCHAGSNFLLRFCVSHRKEELRIVSDQVGAQRALQMTAATTKVLTNLWERNECGFVFSKVSGTYHMSRQVKRRGMTLPKLYSRKQE